MRQGKTRWFERQSQSQFLRRFFNRGAKHRKVEAVACRRQSFGSGITHQIEYLRGRHVIAKEQTGRFGKLVRFVENDRVAGRQQFGGSFVTQHHVGEKEVVIDDHQIGGQGFAACRKYETFLVARAILAETVFARRSDGAPYR